MFIFSFFFFLFSFALWKKNSLINLLTWNCVQIQSRKLIFLLQRVFWWISEFLYGKFCDFVIFSLPYLFFVLLNVWFHYDFVVCFRANPQFQDISSDSIKEIDFSSTEGLWKMDFRVLIRYVSLFVCFFLFF